MTAQAIAAIQKSNISTSMKAVLIAQLEAPTEAKPTAIKAVGTLTCEDCGTETARKSLNQKRCPSCREAKAQGSNKARQQWKEAKAAANAKAKGQGIPEWNVPVLMTLTQALDAGLVVIDAEGNLGPATKVEAPKAKKAKKAKAPKAAKVEVEDDGVDPVLLEQARILVEVGGFTIEEAARLVTSRPVA